jgi:N-acetylmuramoyl-L-alanine amidase
MPYRKKLQEVSSSLIWNSDLNNNWYNRYNLETIRLASIDKEAGRSEDFLSSIVLAVALFLGGSNISEAAEAARVPQKTVENAVQNPNVRNQAILNFDIDKMKNMTNEEKIKYMNSIKGISSKPIAQPNKTVPKPQVATLSTSDAIARTLYAEAEGESLEGKIAVASVIYNRAHGNINKMKSVVTAKWQFSCWNNRTPPKGHGQTWLDCLKITDEMMNGAFTPTTNHTHYYNPVKASPKWANGVKSDRIGNHVFLTPK